MSQKTITVNGIDFNRFNRLRRVAAALTRKSDILKASFNLPDSNEQNTGEYIVCNFSGEIMGKYTIAPRAGFVVKDSFTSRLS